MIDAPNLQELASGLRDSESARLQLVRDLGRLERSRRTRRAGVVAGVGSVVIAVAVLVGRPLLAPPPAAQTLRTAIGGLREARLPDGSTVTLNTDTRLSVSVQGPERHVRLETGEAFFEVAHDGRPFIVSTADAQVRVVGTAFVVRAERGRTVVSVLRGRVAVSDPSGTAAGAALSPGMRLDTTKGRPETPGAPALDPGWRVGRIEFTDARLSDVLAEANRYYPEPLVLTDAKLGDLRLTGAFPTHDSQPLRVTLERVFELQSVSRNGYIEIASAKR